MDNISNVAIIMHCTCHLAPPITGNTFESVSGYALLKFRLNLEPLIWKQFFFPQMSSKASPDGGPTLLEAREARRRAEQDEQLLANRIALLRQEEAKAWKKIQQTKERAEKILAAREENQRETVQRRKVVRKERAREQARLRSKRVARGERSRRLGEREILRKREMVNEIKREKRALQSAKAKRQQEMQQLARARVSEMRKKKAEASAKLRMKTQVKIEEAKEEYQRRVEREEKALRKRERDVRRMEKRERELIERLKKTQMVQSEAYSQLEATLNGGGE